jgi:hypothetical protein
MDFLVYMGVSHGRWFGGGGGLEFDGRKHGNYTVVILLAPAYITNMWALPKKNRKSGWMFVIRILGSGKGENCSL